MHGGCRALSISPTLPFTQRIRLRRSKGFAVSKWLREAEKLAGLQTQQGSLWHAYRRKWVTERKHLPDVDVAAAGGGKDGESLKTAYQQADQGTMLQAVK